MYTGENNKVLVRVTDLYMKLYLWVIGQYPEDTVVTFDGCNNERSCPFLVGRVDLCPVINQ